MGHLSDAAQRGFKRAGGGAYVPNWYKSTMVVGGVFIVTVLAFSAITGEKPQMVEDLPNTQVQANEGILPEYSTVELPAIGGGTENVPQEALSAAEAAALAIWTGDWSEVPVDGELGSTSATYPDAIVGQPSVLSVGAGSISLLFSLDENGDGNWDQDFQVTVVESAAGWSYPSYIG